MKKVLYNYQWSKYSKQYLLENPFCKRHLIVLKQRVKSEVVDHIVPHKGNYELFWDINNHQPLCKLCHDGHKQRFEKSGKIAGCNENGIPLDPNHHWNTKRGTK